MVAVIGSHHGGGDRAALGRSGTQLVGVVELVLLLGGREEYFAVSHYHES
jgi:hypothetical protein